ncbi:MAG: cadherin-like domain-containing protein, partial [Actinomycetota bacterium]|nr:cadherin-like domain-containing protein [Actinomycetota bacterium]
MFGLLMKAALRPVAIVSGGLLAASALLGAASPATAQAPSAHWGNYQWSGGQEKATIRAFWLFDRTGDPTLNAIISYVANAWNGSRAGNPELPYIGVHRDDANAGKCFVNRTPGYSIASACKMGSLSAFGIKGIAATEGSPHIVGGAFAISDGLSFEDAFTAVCHNFGHLMGLPDSNDNESCMSHDVVDGEPKWYGSGDADAILALYAHDDGRAPTATADTYSTNEDIALTVAAPGVLANDSDADGDALTAVKVTDPAHGSVTLNANGSFVYTPTANYNGPDTFTYKASGAGTDSNVVTVTVTVNAVADVPVAVTDTYSTREDTVLTVAAPGVLANDTGPDGTLTTAKVTDPAHGTLTFNADGSFVYTPTANFNGTDSFTYKANDGTSTSNEVA